MVVDDAGLGDDDDCVRELMKSVMVTEFLGVSAAGHAAGSGGRDDCGTY